MSNVLALNLGTSLFLPDSFSISLSFSLRSSKLRSDLPATTKFKKSSPSKPSALVLWIDENLVFVNILFSCSIAKMIFASAFILLPKDKKL